MCEAAAYLVKDGDEELILEAVDVIEPEDGGYRLVSIFGEQKYVNGRIKSINLVNHRVVFEE
ncbi:MAG: CooT family nickel-binding protein [Thermodesulfobacteriota bacterium]